MKIDFSNSPASQGFSFPAEWAHHTATWLSWPHKEESWPGKIDTIYKPYCEFIKILTEGELVRINVADEKLKTFAVKQLQSAGVDLNKIEFFKFPQPMMPGAATTAQLFLSTRKRNKK